MSARSAAHVDRALALDERETIRKEVLAIIGAYPELKQVREIQFPYVAKLYLLRRLS